MKVKAPGFGLSWRPGSVSAPGVRACLEGSGLPRRFFAGTVQIVAEKRSLDPFAELTRRFMAAEGDNTDGFTFCRLPLAMEPRAGNDEIRTVRIVLGSVAKDLPRPPGVLLVPETGDIEVGHGRGVQLADPRFVFPVVVVVRMFDRVVPCGNPSVQILFVDVGKRTQREVPVVSVVGL